MVGSSPHARGTPSSPPTRSRRMGIIPACAGNTGLNVRPGRIIWDHPRMRGEHPSNQASYHPGKGSSPHARGTRADGRPDRMDTRIIPACAGNTVTLCYSFYYAGDHPRMRGEHHRFRWRVRHVGGSSPHARGTRSSRRPMMRITGIIPACAGNTSWRSIMDPRSRDHPRMRGEHVIGFIVDCAHWGSSPHARGTLGEYWLRYGYYGIIPACAGNTANCGPVSVPNGDHPRMRGEH